MFKTRSIPISKGASDGQDIRRRMFLFGLLLAAVVAVIGLIVERLNDDGRRDLYFVAEDGSFMRRLLALPVDEQRKNLVVAIRIIRTVQAPGSEGDRMGKKGMLLNRFLQRLWLSDIRGTPAPIARTLAEAMEVERALSRSKQHDLLSLVEETYSTALQIDLPGSAEPLPELLAEYLKGYANVGTHKWQHRENPHYAIRVPVAFTNLTPRSLALPPLIGIFKKESDASRQVVMECPNGVKAPWQGGGGVPPEWRNLDSGQRAVLLCVVVKGDAFIDEALEHFKERGKWLLRPALYFIFPGGQPPPEDLDIASLLDSEATKQDAQRMLKESSCVERGRCFAEMKAVVSDMVFYRLLWVYGLVAGIVAFSALLRCTGKSPLYLANLLSGAAVLAGIVIAGGIDPRWGVGGDLMVSLIRLQMVEALVAIWLMYALVQLSVMHEARHDAGA